MTPLASRSTLALVFVCQWYAEPTMGHEPMPLNTSLVNLAPSLSPLFKLELVNLPRQQVDLDSILEPALGRQQTSYQVHRNHPSPL